MTDRSLHNTKMNHGSGVLLDNKEAVKWYRLAAEQGIVAAIHNVGMAYKRGIIGLTRPPKSSPNVKLLKTIW